MNSPAAKEGELQLPPELMAIARQMHFLNAQSDMQGKTTGELFQAACQGVGELLQDGCHTLLADGSIILDLRKW
ncbi:MAG TPA: hypothetical protein VJB96_00785 [Patescibacteria group bacterium]|nr:hypothetical protein [Patescibacteria group bacterium]